MYFYPLSLPTPQQSGYSRKFQPNILRTQMSDGYVRQRLINQGAPDFLSVTWIFNEKQFSEFLNWYKGNIHYGADWFVCPLLSLDGNAISYQYCRIQKGQFTQNLLYRNEENSVYKISCTLDVSSTIVDDGSWQEHFISSKNAEETLGEVQFIESAPSANVDLVIEEKELVTPTAIINKVESDSAVSSITAIEEDSDNASITTIKSVEKSTDYDEV